MTNAQNVALRLSKVRERLNEIAGLEGDAFSDEIRTEAGTLQAEYSDLEVRHRAAIVAEPPETVTETGGRRRRSGGDSEAPLHPGPREARGLHRRPRITGNALHRRVRPKPSTTRRDQAAPDTRFPVAGCSRPRSEATTAVDARRPDCGDCDLPPARPSRQRSPGPTRLALGIAMPKRYRLATASFSGADDRAARRGMKAKPRPPTDATAAAFALGVSGDAAEAWQRTGPVRDLGLRTWRCCRRWSPTLRTAICGLRWPTIHGLGRWSTVPARGLREPVSGHRRLADRSDHRRERLSQRQQGQGPPDAGRVHFLC